MGEPYLAASKARGKDVAVLTSGGRECGSVYLAGYIVELKLKALMELENRTFPSSGRAGHDLRHLWEAAGFKRTDLRGNRRLFVDEWSVALRYQDSLPARISFDAMHNGAVELAGYLQLRLRTPRRIRR